MERGGDLSEGNEGQKRALNKWQVARERQEKAKLAAEAVARTWIHSSVETFCTSAYTGSTASRIGYVW